MNLFDPDQPSGSAPSPLFTAEVREVIAACERYKGEHHTRYMSVEEIVHVMKSIGWAKTGVSDGRDDRP